MSPTCKTRLTNGSALTALMNAGVATVSLVSVGVVPYGASPYTAIVEAAVAPAPGILQEICTVCVSAQLAAGSPSDALTVNVTGPGATQAKVGVADVASLSVPELEVQW